MILYLLCVVCLMWFVNCLLKCSDFCLSVIAVLLLKVMFGICGGFLCARPFIVFQSVWVFVLWSQFSVTCCFQSACLWFSISLSILVFCFAISGSLGFFVVLFYYAVLSCFLCVLAVVCVCDVFFL